MRDADSRVWRLPQPHRLTAGGAAERFAPHSAWIARTALIGAVCLVPASVLAEERVPLELRVVRSEDRTESELEVARSATFQILDPITRQEIASWNRPYNVALDGFQVDTPASGRGVVVRATVAGAWSPSVYLAPGNTNLKPFLLVPERKIVLRIRSSDRAVERLGDESLYVVGRVWSPADRVAVSSPNLQDGQPKATVGGRGLPSGLYRGPCDGEWTEDETEFIVTCPFAAGQTAQLRVWLGPFQAWTTTLSNASGDLVFDLDEPALGATVTGRLGGESEERVWLAAIDGRISPATWTDQTGFFELEGLSPGRFDLRLVGSPLNGWPVYVENLGDRVDLGDLQSAASNRLTVELRSSSGAAVTDLAVSATKVELSELDEVVRYGRQFDSELLDDGLFTWRGLPEGDYLLGVSSEQGDRYRSELVRFLGMDHVVLDLDLVPLEGVVRRGRDGLEDVLLWFGGRYGDERVTMRSREDGVFRGHLAREGEWVVELTAAPQCDPCEGPWAQDRETVEGIGFVEVEAGDDGVARIELDLPDGVVLGHVVAAEEGDELQGVPGVSVRVTRADETFRKGTLGLGPWTTRSGELGAFTLEGLAEGDYLVFAEEKRADRVRAVGNVQFQLTETGEPAELRLLLREQQRIRVSVQSGGAPVTSAALWVRSGMTWRAQSPLSVGGQATFWLPPPVSTVDAFIWVDDFGAMGVRHAYPDDVIVVELRRERGDLRVPWSQAGRLVAESGAWIELGRLLGLASRAVVMDGDDAIVRGLAPGQWLWCPPDSGACVSAVITPWAETQAK